MRRIDDHRASLDRVQERIERSDADQRGEQRRRRFSHAVAQRRADLNYYEAQALGPREGVVLVWAGMRGAVTLAAAQTLPPDVEHRSLIVLTAFVVAAGTLLLQGGTLPWVVRALRLSEPDEAAEAAAARERLDLRRELVAVATATLADPDLVRADGSAYSPEALESMQRGGAIGSKRRDAEQDTTATDDDLARVSDAMLEHRELRLALIAAQRDELLRLRSVGDYSSAALAGVLAGLDADELGIEARFE